MRETHRDTETQSSIYTYLQLHLAAKKDIEALSKIPHPKFIELQLSCSSNSPPNL
jgi:hypothetical protein